MMGALIGAIVTRTGWPEKVARAAAMAAFAVLLAVLIGGVLAVSRCTSGGQQRAQARVDAGQSAAFTNSVSDAVATEQAATARENASDELSRSNEEEIRNAQGADDKVDPAVSDAGLRSLCRRAAYRDSPRCKLLKPAP